jgi:hypothetical protein
MAVERPKIHFGIMLGNIKEEERKVSTAKSEEKVD